PLACAFCTPSLLALCPSPSTGPSFPYPSPINFTPSLFSSAALVFPSLSYLPVTLPSAYSPTRCASGEPIFILFSLGFFQPFLLVSHRPCNPRSFCLTPPLPLYGTSPPGPPTQPMPIHLPILISLNPLRLAPYLDPHL
ncbi:hypothetical protein AMTR_s00039p00130380, partial [Amborella trichopoda]